MFKEGLLKGKRILITGGGTGLGKEIATRYAALGADLWIAGRRGGVLEDTARELSTQFGVRVKTQSIDIRDAAAVDAMVQRIWDEDGPLTGLVNNAAGNFIAQADQLSTNGWNTVINIVLNGTFYCSSAVGKKMIERGNGGVMLNTIANYAWTGGPGVVHSASAKAGVLALTRTLAVEWARHKIRINAIAPGPVDTPGAAERLFPDPMIMEGIRKTIPLRRFATLEEVANAASYLLSDYASYVTGENFVIDGGQWLSGADYFTRLKQMMPR